VENPARREVANGVPEAHVRSRSISLRLDEGGDAEPWRPRLAPVICGLGRPLSGSRTDLAKVCFVGDHGRPTKHEEQWPSGSDLAQPACPETPT